MQTIARRPSPAVSMLALFLCIVALFCAVAVHAGETKAQKKKKPEHVSAAKAQKGAKVKTEKNAGETTAERDRRLQRECKGRPNAGACLGYGG